jgi:hypothetical protein
VKVDAARLNKKSIASFSFRAGWTGERIFRAKWPSQHDDHEAGTSKGLTISSRG